MTTVTPTPSFPIPDHKDASRNEIDAADSSDITRILLICHAEGMHDRYEELLTQVGADDSGLTALGWQQSDKLASWLKTHERIEVLVSGTQLHSRLTAQRIGQALGLPISVAEELPGRLGEEDALSDMAAGPDELDPEIHTSTHHAVVRPYIEFHHALISSLVKVLQTYPGKTIAILSSNSGIATILRHFFGAHQLLVQISHTGVSEIRHDNGRWYLQYVNRTEHLPQPPLHFENDKRNLDDPQENEDVSLIAHTYNTVAQQIEDWYDDRTMAGITQRIEHLLDFASLPPDLQTLDVGSGIGLLALLLAARGAREAIGIDVSLSMLERAEFIRLSNANHFARNVNFRLAPAQAMPFRNERFDATFCRLVLSHARAPEQILAEIYRMLKPGGILILADLITDDDPVKRATQNAIESKRNPCHVAARTKDQYRKLLAESGFDIVDDALAVFERDLEEWLMEIQTAPEDRVAVREMVEASLETDAAGMNARRVADSLLFDQQLYYLKAVKRYEIGAGQ